jgi:Peptidase inhibitor I78 family.
MFGRNIFIFDGQPKSAIAAIEYPYNTRLFYLGEEKAEGFVANRLNLILDNSEKIVQVYCG